METLMTSMVQRHRRRESNRQSARRHYHKKREEIERLRAEAAALEKQFSANRPFLRGKYLPVEQDNGVELSIKTLRRENTALRMRLDQFLAWEKKLNVICVDRERALASAPSSDISAMHQKTSQSRIRLKKPLTVQECHAIARRVYSEIVSFNSSGKDGTISTGASVFGWTDQRRIDNGLLKFSISKLNTCMSPEEVSSSIWSLLSAPNGFSKVLSQTLNMHSEVVQVVDHSNVIVLQESRVHSNTGGTPTVTIVRALVLLTLFATENGYVFADYGLDPELAIIPPNSYLGPVPPDNVIVQHVWEPIFCWGTFERVEGAPHQCLSGFVGTFPVEGANYRNWAVEVLLLVLRIDGFLLAPQWILPQEE